MDSSGNSLDFVDEYRERFHKFYRNCIADGYPACRPYVVRIMRELSRVIDVMLEVDVVEPDGYAELHADN